MFYTLEFLYLFLYWNMKIKLFYIQNVNVLLYMYVEYWYSIARVSQLFDIFENKISG